MPPKHEKEMKEILKRLDHQDKQLEQLIWCMKGNIPMNIEGVMPAVKRIEKEMKDVKTSVGEITTWKQLEQAKKGTISLKSVAAGIGAVATVVGIVVGIAELVKNIF